MSTDREWQRLCDLYAEKTDGELLALYADREDLTEIAQQALKQVMHERHLTPADTEEDAMPEESDLPETSEELLPSEFVLWRFVDGWDASCASVNLKDAGIRNRVIAVGGPGWNGVRSTQLNELRVVVAKEDRSKAESTLRDTMGLFPQPEDGSGAQLELLSDLTVLVMFQREFELDKALGLAQTLASNGVSFLWRDGGDAPASLPDADFVAIEVRQTSLPKAQGLMEQFVATLPEDELSHE